MAYIRALCNRLWLALTENHRSIAVVKVVECCGIGRFRSLRYYHMRTDVGGIPTIYVQSRLQSDLDSV